MFSVVEDVEADALFKRGWTVSAIARHVDRDRKTVRSYLSGERTPGVRRTDVSDPLDEYRAYVSARFVDDPHLWASALFDEVVALGYPSSYVSFARQIRLAGLRPHCEACSGVKGRETIEIDHPSGEEIQWDWFERRNAPWGATAYGLLGTLSHSGRTRGVLAESMDQAHLIEAMDAVMLRLGGTARKWRTDWLATVIVPGTADVQASLAPVAKYYGAIVTPCPPRRGNRKGAVECGVKFCCGRWWRTMTATTMADAQVSMDHFWSTTGDARLRPPGRYLNPEELREQEGRPTWPTVGELAAAEELMALPSVPYPATIEVQRVVDDKASVAFRGNRYSVPPGMGGAELTLRHRLGTGSLEVPQASSWCPITSSGRAPARWCAPRPTGLPSNQSCSPSSRRSVPVTAKATSPPVRPPWPSGSVWSTDRAPSRVSTSMPWPRSSPWPSPGRPRPGRCRHE
jgi:hypothetical protein